MATRLNFPNETFGQLVRFAIVGFSLAVVYSAIYWYLATYVMAPVLAVVIAFLVSVSIGFVLHSRTETLDVMVLSRPEVEPS